MDVFTINAGVHFKNFTCNNVNKQEVELWMKKQFQGLIA